MNRKREIRYKYPKYKMKNRNKYWPYSYWKDEKALETLPGFCSENLWGAPGHHCVVSITGRSYREQTPRFWSHQPKEALQAQHQWRRAAKWTPGTDACHRTKRITRQGTFCSPVFPLKLNYCLGPEADGTVDVTDETVNVIAKQWSVEVTSQTHAVDFSQVPPWENALLSRRKEVKPVMQVEICRAPALKHAKPLLG